MTPDEIVVGIPSITLADVRAFGSTEWSALTDMRDLGFRFCLTDVSDLEYEFSALRAAGFDFARLDATSCLGGLPGPSGHMAADQVCHYLGEQNLTVIVARIDDEATRANVVKLSVALGQGALFGPPVRVDTDAAPGHAAA